MPWNEVKTYSSTLDIKKDTPGEVQHQGKYIGHDSIDTPLGKQVVWNFSGEDGDFSIYGFTNLNKILEGLPENTDLQITYMGTKNVRTKYGQKNVHQVRVEVWKEE